MLKMIRQFTFHHPKEIIQPTFWLFFSQAVSILPAILAYVAIYALGQAFYPPYTLDVSLLIRISAIGIGYVELKKPSLLLLSLLMEPPLPQSMPAPSLWRTEAGTPSLFTRWVLALPWKT